MNAKPDQVTKAYLEAGVSQYQDYAEQSDVFDFDRFFAVGARQWRKVAISVCLAVVLGFAYLTVATRYYTSSVGILIDPGATQIFDQLAISGGELIDDASILSQVEILRSDKIAAAVIAKLNLGSNPAFLGGDKPGILTRLVDRIGYAFNVRSDKMVDIDSAERRRQWLFGRVQRGLSVNRVGKTYVLQVSFTSIDPRLSAEVAGSFAEAYLADQLDSKYESTRRASEWLQNRISELREQSLKSDVDVQNFKAQNGLISADGKLISDQQLTEINSQLISARAETASAEAKFARIGIILKQGDMDAAVSESLDSAVIGNLRAKYFEASRRQTDIAKRLGAKHAQVIRLSAEVNEYRRLMFEELSRIAQSYQSNLEVSRSRQLNLEKQVVDATGASTVANDSQVELRELERKSEAYKKLYETFLQRYQETIQQGSFPITEARVISSPAIATGPSSPRFLIVILITAVVGAAVGFIVSAWSEFRDRYFRTADQVIETLGLEPLGGIPLISGTKVLERNVNRGANAIGKESSITNYVIEHPLSAFAETLRNAKIAVDLKCPPDKSPKLIGVASVVPGEGKSIVSINLAELLAGQGHRTLLVDADIRNPGATRYIGRHADKGLLEALGSDLPLDDFLMVNSATNLAFLPTIAKRAVTHSSEILASRLMDRLIADAANRYDYIVFDLPPLAPVVDAKIMGSKIDACLLVVEWGETRRSVVKKFLSLNPATYEKCAGVILNKVDMSTIKLYDTGGGADLYYSKYSDYIHS